ncbi:DUF3073 domain-containing protein [Jatrophihabitans lederbergiae]|jgi:hypothetical protein|uniref:DUF3073 domain-containing protein n=1 Tax=Jatrophihabitans lederbergiae TaxID=3075547 RepID=A0ABU2J8P7_9ACTN|nr:DUF3073 domain-containing protein [Jatrophihabitans sp. DSM 44399]MDT0261009.1 DUF3073 domain-containing protein [Jatrophihabitans sp. DSM 44399]
MGRGRAKAKQQKVARELKYNTQSTDFTALQRELGHPAEPGYHEAGSSGDPYADDDLEDEETWASGTR